MISQTDKNLTSFITTSNINEFNDFAISGIYIFAEKELISKKESVDIETGNEAEDQDQTTNPAVLFNMKQKTVNEYSYQDDGGQIILGFKENESLVNLTSITFGMKKYDATMEHYSLSADKSRMSFLFNVKTKDDGQVLLSATFYRNSEKKVVPKVSANYQYLYGPGVVVPWKLYATRKVTVDVCPSVTEHLYFSKVKVALKAWEEPFNYKTQKLEIVVNELTSCKPFSDVDQHSIHYIDTYLTMPEKNAYNPGFTMVHSDFSQGSIFDADIILLGSEIAKDPNISSMEYDRILTHEFGHFLGLDHQFDGTTSIMSYESTYYLGTYDDDAITELYKN